MIKTCVVGICAITSFYAICQHSTNFKGNILFRLGRAGFTVASMTKDYKLFYYNNDPNDLKYGFLLSKVHKHAAEKLLNLSIVNGGCFIKIGQHLGSLTYLLPQEYVDTLSVLHDNVPNEPFDSIYNIIKEEIGCEPSEVFSDISPIPLGTASLAQVHRAKLKDSNVEVAIKVQHRQVKDHAIVDLWCMDVLFSVISRIFPQMKLEWLAEETRKNLPKELNFILEGKNADNLRKRISNKLPFLKIPTIMWNYSTEKLLIMEYCSGGKVTDRLYMESQGISTKEVSQSLCKLYCEMIFNQGFVHCDPHPGNILVRPVGIKYYHWVHRFLNWIGWCRSRTFEIVLLDHGLYQNLSDEFLTHYTLLWIHMINKNEEGMRQEASYFGIRENFHRLLACMVTGRSWLSLEKGISNSQFTAEEAQFMRTNAHQFLIGMVDILNSVPRQMLLLFKTNDLLRGVEHTLMGTSYSKASMGVLTMFRYCIYRIFHFDAQLIYREQNPIIFWTQNILLRLKLYWNLFCLEMYSLL